MFMPVRILLSLYSSHPLYNFNNNNNIVGEQCPKARPIIHLGATSCFVADNTDVIQIKEALVLIKQRLIQLIDCMEKFARKHRAMPTLGFTHYQPAQLVTVGKRCSLWLQDFVMDANDLIRLIDSLPMRGAKGTTGTQASYLSLFNGDRSKVRKLDQRVCELLGFKTVLPVTGQTYTRKIDFKVLSVLSGIAQSAHKLAVDVRLLMNLKEAEEPFGKSQIGSSAMAYKRNPMRSERICSLARYVISLTSNTANTHAQQWFERTLDDSANRRVVLPEAFLALDVVLRIAHNVMSGLTLWPKVIASHIDAELPFMATEEILMACVKAGGDRQELHEAIREHSMKAAAQVKAEGKRNDLLDRLASDPLFKAIHNKLDKLVDPKLFIGCCAEQVDEFLSEVVSPLLKQHEELLSKETKDKISV
jgi:adenylosuccinate lyase